MSMPASKMHPVEHLVHLVPRLESLSLTQIYGGGDQTSLFGSHNLPARHLSGNAATCLLGAASLSRLLSGNCTLR